MPFRKARRNSHGLNSSMTSTGSSDKSQPAVIRSPHPPPAKTEKTATRSVYSDDVGDSQRVAFHTCSAT